MIGCTMSQNKFDCTKYRIGKFEYHGTKSGNSYIIERNDSNQIETNLSTGSITRLSIKWTGPCEYELRYLSRQSSPGDTLVNLATTIVLKTRIIAVTSKYCIFSSQADGVDKILTDTLKLMKQEPFK